MSDTTPARSAERMPRWVWKAVAIFWLGAVAALAVRDMWAPRRCVPIHESQRGNSFEGVSW